jgi:hypothetical protein
VRPCPCRYTRAANALLPCGRHAGHWTTWRYGGRTDDHWRLRDAGARVDVEATYSHSRCAHATRCERYACQRTPRDGS